MGNNIAKLVNIVFIAATAGCAAAGSSVVAPSPTAAPVSFDGNYRGTILLTSKSSLVGGAQSDWCDTPRNISLTIQNNVFNYVLAHPNVPQDSGYSLSPNFAVTVAPDSSFQGSSQNGDAQMTGRITGTHLAGQINGTACDYAFTAERS